RKVAALLRQAGWIINDKRVERIWRREGLKVPHKQPKRGRLWLTDGSCIRLRPEQHNHVWSYDFVEDRTHEGRKYRMLNVLDEFTHECLAIRVARKLKAIDVIYVLSDLFILRGIPAHIRSNNGPEFVAQAVQEWIAAVGAKTAYIERGSPWENGYIESFNARLRDELLDGEIFYTLREAQIVIESWRRHYKRASQHPSVYVIGMRSRGVPWVLACAFGDGTRRRCGENGTAEDPGTVRQRVECLDLISFRRNPECFRRHLKKPRGIVEVKPRFDSVVSRLVDGDAVIGAQRGDTLARPAIAIAGHQPVPVQDAGDEIVVGDQHQLAYGGNHIGPSCWCVA